MAYQRTTWRNEETPLSAGNFNNIEDGVEEALAVTRNITTRILDMFYPIGSYYETSDGSFDPAATWGGTWVLESAGLVHVSAGTGYTIGATGGTPDAVVPAHTHPFRNPTISRTTNVGVSVSGGAHNHTYQYANRASFKESGSGTVHYQHSGYTATNTGGTGTHTHSVSVTQPTFSASGGAVQSAGVDGTGANMPPYVVVNRWHRTA